MDKWQEWDYSEFDRKTHMFKDTELRKKRRKEEIWFDWYFKYPEGYEVNKIIVPVYEYNNRSIHSWNP